MGDNGDSLDHRDVVGRFVLSEVIECDHENYQLLIHYEGWSSRYDTWCNYVQESHRFARANSISRLQPQRLTDLTVGDKVDLCRNPWDDLDGGLGKWRPAKIKRFDAESSQVEVMYVKEVRADGIRGYRRWVSLDSVDEIDYFGTHLYESESHCDELMRFQEDGELKKVIGLPLTVWIGADDTLQDIIDENMNGSADFVKSIYREKKSEDKFVKIAKYKRDVYKLFGEILEDGLDEILLIKIQTNRVKNGYIPTFPDFVHE